MSTFIIYCFIFTGCSHETPKPMTSYYDTVVYITDHDMKYHRDGCKYLEYSKVPITLEQAKERNLSSCPICKPSIIGSKTDDAITLNKPSKLDEYPK
jgi:hypothetical protein